MTDTLTPNARKSLSRSLLSDEHGSIRAEAIGAMAVGTVVLGVLVGVGYGTLRFWDAGLDDGTKSVVSQIATAQHEYYVETAEDGDPRYGTLEELQDERYIIKRDDLRIEIEVNNEVSPDPSPADTFTVYAQSDTDQWFAITNTTDTPQAVDHVGAEPVPVVEESPTEPVDMSWVLPTLGVGVGVAAVGTGGLFAVRAGKRRRRNRTVEARAWAAVRARHNAARSVVASYELDVAKAIDYPAFNDVTVPDTAAMARAMRRARDAEASTTTGQTIGGTKAELDRYMEAVTAFESAVEVAERAARRIAWSGVSVKEQQDLAQAKALLAHATSPGNTAEARSTYYVQLQRVIRRLNDRHNVDIIPGQVITAIETQARLAVNA